MSGIYLTKNAPVLQKFAPPKVGEQRVLHVKFMPADAGELKALGEDLPDGYVAGWASTDDLDYYNHRVMAGAFQESIEKRGLTGPKGIKILIGHDWNKVAGVIKKLEYRGTRLWIEAQLNLSIGYAKDAYEAAKMVGGLSFSVGFILEKYGIEVQEDGDRDYEWLRIDKGDLYEVSVVPFPGNEEATMEFVKSRGGINPEQEKTTAETSDEKRSHTTIAEFEKALVASGLVKSRNDAKRVTQAVNASSALFTKGAGKTPAVLPPPTVVPPVLALEKVTELSELVKKMKETLTRIES